MIRISAFITTLFAILSFILTFSKTERGQGLSLGTLCVAGVWGIILTITLIVEAAR